MAGQAKSCEEAMESMFRTADAAESLHELRSKFDDLAKRMGAVEDFTGDDESQNQLLRRFAPAHNPQQTLRKSCHNLPFVCGKSLAFMRWRTSL
jgi:hypothetical protein